jgi:hypothetical protein
LQEKSKTGVNSIIFLEYDLKACIKIFTFYLTTFPLSINPREIIIDLC